MRAFNVLVYEGWVTNTEKFSDPQHNELLGRADELRIQVNFDQYEGVGSDTLTVKYYDSMDNTYFAEHSTVLNAVGVTSVPDSEFGSTSSSTPNGAYGRLGFVTGASGTKYYVRCFACGRAS